MSNLTYDSTFNFGVQAASEFRMNESSMLQGFDCSVFLNTVITLVGGQHANGTTKMNQQTSPC